MYTKFKSAMNYEQKQNVGHFMRDDMQICLLFAGDLL